jgi:selenium metabolism protein YedF
MRIIDARGQACPQPVILARKAMADSNDLTVIVDDETAQMNVSRMAEKAGYHANSERKDEGIFIHLAKAADAEAEPIHTRTMGKCVILVTDEGLGRGNDELGGILMRGFLHALNEGELRPAILIFMNSGVRLVAQGSMVLEDVRSLFGRGVQVWACGTCLDFYALKDKVAVGQVSNMYSIVEALSQADKVVTL